MTMTLTADEFDLIQTYWATDAKGQALVRKKAHAEARQADAAGFSEVHHARIHR